MRRATSTHGWSALLGGWGRLAGGSAPGSPSQPCRLLADASGYIYTWLLGYSGGLGSIAGVLIADYWIVRRRELKLEDLYLADGSYRYPGGRNRRPGAHNAA